MINVNSIIKMDWGRIQALTDAQVTALEQTAEYLHTEVVQAQVMPFDKGRSRMTAHLLIIQKANPERCPLYLHSLMPGVCIIIRNIISRQKKIPMRVVNGTKTGCLEEVRTKTAKRHLKQIYKRITGV